VDRLLGTHDQLGHEAVGDGDVEKGDGVTGERRESVDRIKDIDEVPPRLDGRGAGWEGLSLVVVWGERRTLGSMIDSTSTFARQDFCLGNGGQRARHACHVELPWVQSLCKGGAQRVRLPDGGAATRGEQLKLELELKLELSIDPGLHRVFVNVEESGVPRRRA
jgi:hypothetical protein